MQSDKLTVKQLIAGGIIVALIVMLIVALYGSLQSTQQMANQVRPLMPQYQTEYPTP